MTTGPEAASQEKCLCDLLDALEAGLLRLRQERDELRRSAGNGSKARTKKAKAKKKAVSKKPVSQKPAKKAVKPVPVAESAEPETRPKAPPKKRQALGRTLLQIRPRREPGA